MLLLLSCFVDDAEWCARLDHDGDGWMAFAEAECPGAPAEPDCDEDDAARNPGREETVDGVDEDCDAVVDDGTAAFDDDGDCQCEAACSGSVATCDTYTKGDCDDEDPTVFAGAVETADGRDEDCDGVIDEETEAFDDDGDCYCEADCTGTVGDCDGLASGDCDDAAADVHPGATETVDARDEDCDGATDEGTRVFDDDGDCYCENTCVGSIAECVDMERGDCDDDDPTTFPGAEEVCGDHRVNSCASNPGDAEALCGMEEAIALSDVAPRLDGAVEGLHLGRSVAAVPDLSGDGVGDLVISAYADTTATETNGRVWVYEAPTGDLDVPDGAFAELAPPSGALGFGWHVDGIGDLDGDGLGDVVVASPSAERVWISHGLDDWPDSATTVSAWADTGFGTSIAVIPDCDNDELPELVVGAPRENAVYFIRGSSLRDPGEISAWEVEATGSLYGGGVGEAVGSAGDVDGDGIPEVLTGAPGDDSAGTDAGLVMLSPADGSGFYTQILGAGAGDRFGSTLTGIGDANGDGHDDLLIGGSGATEGEAIAWYLRNVTSDTTAAFADAQLLADDDEDEGILVASTGDIDGDGDADLLLSRPSSDRVFVFYAPASGTVVGLSQASVVLSGAAGDAAGTAIAGVGDQNADGVPDFLVGAPDASPGGLSGAGSAWLVLASGY